MFWHGGFPLAVMAYAWLKDRDGDVRQVRSSRTDRAVRAILAGIAVVLLAALPRWYGSRPRARRLLPPLVQQQRLHAPR